MGNGRLERNCLKYKRRDTILLIIVSKKLNSFKKGGPRSYLCI